MTVNTTMTNINFTPKNMLGLSAWTGPQAPCSQARTGWYTCPALIAPSLCSSTIKKSGTEDRKTPDIRLRFVGFNFGHVQLLMFIVVVIRSYSFCHLDLAFLVSLFLLAHYKFIKFILFQTDALFFITIE